MSVITIRQYLDLQWPLTNVLAIAFVSVDNGTGSSTRRELDVSNGAFMVVEGTDLVVDVNGRLESGIVTAFSIFSDDSEQDLLLTMSGASMDVATALAAFLNNDDDYAFAGPGDSIDFDASSVGPTEEDNGVGWFEGSENADTITGSQGSELLSGYGGDDTLDGQGGYDVLFGGAGADVLNGGDHGDTLMGGDGADTLDGGDGYDFAEYRDKTQMIEVALNGANQVGLKVNGVVEDTLSNVEGVFGGSAGDRLTGDAFENYFAGGGGKDTIDGGRGLDIADYSDKTKSIVVTLNGSTEVTVKVGGKSEDKIKNIEGIFGGKAGDTITGDKYANWVAGHDGNDTISGGSGRDTINGDLGDDSLYGGSSSDRLVGGDGRDMLSGGSSGDLLIGVTGKDTLLGGSGNDTLVGGDGKDVLTGGTGADIFFFGSAPFKSNADKITDFKHDTDRIELLRELFPMLGAKVTKSELRFGTSAKDSNDFLIYDKNTGALYIDPDANGSAPKYLIATLTNKASIDYGDIFMIA